MSELYDKKRKTAGEMTAEEMMKNNSSGQKMKIYMFGYGTYEESEYTYLTHEKSFTQEEFKQMIFDSVYDAIIKEKKQEYSYLHGYDDIHDKAVDVMKSKHGFKDLDITQHWTCFGWASIFKHGDWGSNRDEPDEITELVTYLNNRGLTETNDDFLRRYDTSSTTKTDMVKSSQIGIEIQDG